MDFVHQLASAILVILDSVYFAGGLSALNDILQVLGKMFIKITISLRLTQIVSGLRKWLQWLLLWMWFWPEDDQSRWGCFQFLSLFSIPWKPNSFKRDSVTFTGSTPRMALEMVQNAFLAKKSPKNDILGTILKGPHLLIFSDKIPSIYDKRIIKFGSLQSPILF